MKKQSLFLWLGLAPTMIAVGCGGGSVGSTTGSTGLTGSTSGGGAVTTIVGLKTISTVGSTVDPGNGDMNPYGLAIVGHDFPGDSVANHVQPGDILVSNFSAAAGTNGTGTTIEAIRNGLPVRVFSETNAPFASGGTVNGSGPVQLAVGPQGALWIANYGTMGSDGNVEVVSTNGTVEQNITDPRVIAAWGQAYNGKSSGAPVFFSSDVASGSVFRLTPDQYLNVGIQQLTGDLGHSGSNATTAVGPQGMAHAGDDTLYVVDGVNNTLTAIPASSTTMAAVGGSVIFRGAPLNQPVGLTINPLNGDLIVSNQGDNNLVEITKTGTLVGTKQVDPHTVTNGVGTALFNILATTDPSGNLLVYFVNDLTNSLNALSK